MHDWRIDGVERWSDECLYADGMEYMHYAGCIWELGMHATIQDVYGMYTTSAGCLMGTGDVRNYTGSTSYVCKMWHVMWRGDVSVMYSILHGTWISSWF